MIIASRVVNNDEEANSTGDNHETLERKIQEEVESRILRNQNNAAIAEPIGADGMLNPSSKFRTIG